MKRLFLLSILFAFTTLTFAFPLHSSTYEVESTFNGLSGNIGDSNSYSARFLMTAFQETGKGDPPNIEANVGVFNNIFPDLIVFSIAFNSSNPDEEENITILAVVGNQGSKKAKDFFVDFYDGNESNLSQVVISTIFVDQIKKFSNVSLNTTWIATPVGPHNITVSADPTHVVIESNESNNNLTVVLHVKSLAVYFGHTVGNLTLATSLNQSEYKWVATDAGNIYFSNSDANISFNDLVALGRNISGDPVKNDFLYVDQNIRMVNFNDSIQRIWAQNASTPKQTTNFTVFGTLIQNVPYINSTNSSNFISGILWDSKDDTDGRYGPTDKEDLVFVTNINRNQSGKIGVFDYEAKIPVLLRVYNSTSNQLKYFLELR